MIENLFDHKCSIKHLVESQTQPGYGLPISREWSYPESPDISSVECHFSISKDMIVQTEASNRPRNFNKLICPIGTDIRLNDLIVDIATGEVYKAKHPRAIRDNHIYVDIESYKDDL